jgi:hypothetical protein
VLYETEYFYGPDDKLIRTTSYSFSGGQSRKQEYSENQYDQEGNLATSTLYALQAAGTFGVQATTTYTWQSGLLRREQTSHVGGPGSTISYDYQDGRLTEKTGSGMNGQKENSVVYLYDDPGKLIRETHLSAAGKKVSYAVIA